MLTFKRPLLAAPLLPPSVEQLDNYCCYLTTVMDYDDKVGVYYWPHVGIIKEPEDLCECGICTNGAILIAKFFKGSVFGYPISEGQTFVGYSAYGHDFAVVGDYIVDWWGWEYEKTISNPVIKISEGISKGYYKPQDLWFPNKKHNYAIV